MGNSGPPEEVSRLAGPSEITYSQVSSREITESSSDDLRDLPPERRRKIERIRREIQDGKYETREKLEKAIDRMLEDLV